MTIEDIYTLCDELYNVGYRDAQREYAYDPRGCQEWEDLVDYCLSTLTG